MALLEKLDFAVDKDASDMCGRVGLGTSNITAHWGLTPLKKYKLFKWGTVCRYYGIRSRCIFAAYYHYAKCGICSP